VSDLSITTTEMHTGGEAVRIVTGGWPSLGRGTILEKRRRARAEFDHLRRFLMHEPRGHAEMYGALLVEPNHPEADLAVLFMHNEGWSTMCGHATIALGRWAVDTGRVPAREPETIVRLECPCGLVETRVEVAEGRAGAVRFSSVPAFAFALDAEIATPRWGKVRVDIGYGGAFYAFLPAARLGLDLDRSPVLQLTDAGEALTKAAAEQIKLEHPDDADLAFLYGTILTDGGDGREHPSKNVCIFAGRQVDRSPTGSGVTARVALARARSEMALGEARRYASLTGAVFTGKALAETRAGRFAAIIAEVGGKAHYSGEARFTWEADDPLKEGFLL
jgi:proline racemase